MGFGFKKSIKVVPGVRLNVGKMRSSVSLGGKGLTTNISKRGVKTTASIPGTGMSYTSDGSRSKGTKRKDVPTSETASGKGSVLSGFLMLVGIAAIIYVVVRLLF